MSELADTAVTGIGGLLGGGLTVWGVMQFLHRQLREDIAALRLQLKAEQDSRESMDRELRTIIQTGDDKSFQRADQGLKAQRDDISDHSTRLGRVEGFLGALGSGPAELKGRP